VCVCVCVAYMKLCRERERERKSFAFEAYCWSKRWFYAKSKIKLLHWSENLHRNEEMNSFQH